MEVGKVFSFQKAFPVLFLKASCLLFCKLEIIGETVQNGVHSLSFSQYSLVVCRSYVLLSGYAVRFCHCLLPKYSLIVILGSFLQILGRESL